MLSTAPALAAGRAAMAAGPLLALLGVLQLTAADEVRTGDLAHTTLGHVTLTAMAAALLLVVPALLELGRRAGAVIAARTTAAGHVLLAVAGTVSNVLGHDPLLFTVAAPLANGLWLVGTIALAVRARRAGAHPALVAGLPLTWALTIPLSIVGGPVLAGAFWLAAGLRLAEPPQDVVLAARAA